MTKPIDKTQVIMVIALIVGVIGAYAIVTSVMDAIRIEKEIEQDKENIINTVHDKYKDSITPNISQQQTFKEDIKKEFDLAKKRCEAKLPFVTIFGIEEELKNVYGINNVKAVSNNSVPEIEIKKDGMTAYVDIKNNVRIK